MRLRECIRNLQTLVESLGGEDDPYCWCLGWVLDEETRQLQDGGLGRTKETKKKHAITTSITHAIT